jgi:hypothetical protein
MQNLRSVQPVPQTPDYRSDQPPLPTLEEFQYLPVLDKYSLVQKPVPLHYLPILEPFYLQKIP